MKDLDSKKKKELSAPFKGYIPIKQKLTQSTVEDFSENIIKRDDGLSHMLLSDVNNLMLSIVHDFPEIAKSYSIGKSYEGRDINVIELTAKTTVTSEKKEGKEKEEKASDKTPVDTGLV